MGRLDHLSKQRTYEYDPRHLPLMVRDFVELATVRLLNRKTRVHTIGLGRSMRTHAFEARDVFPALQLKDLPAFVGAPPRQELVLPPLDDILLAGLGGALPYAVLATIAAALQPENIFEAGTFRGVSTLTLALNAPKAQIYTLDLPPDFDDENTRTLNRADKEWARLARGTVGVAFEGHPAAARIHQIHADSTIFDAAGVIPPVELCFIDGGHSYECVKADTENSLKILKKGGIILWDDYNWWIRDVRAYLMELLATKNLRRLAGTQYVIWRND